MFRTQATRLDYVVVCTVTDNIPIPTMDGNVTNSGGVVSIEAVYITPKAIQPRENS